MLETFDAQLRNRWAVVGFIALVGIVAMTVADRGFAWMSTWWLWLFALPVSLLGLRRDRMAAGADWFRTHNWKRSVVNTYELTSVQVGGTATGVSWRLYLRDHTSRDVGAALYELQRQPALWDLVYNGICHSIANGAETNAKTWRHLQLPERLREQVEQGGSTQPGAS